MAGRAVVMRVGGAELLVETSPVAGTEQTSVKLDKAQEAVTDAFHRGLDLIHGDAQTARHFRHLPLFERFHEIANDAVLERFLTAGAFQLQHQTFAHVARGHAGRMKGLDDFEDFGNFFGRDAGGQSDQRDSDLWHRGSGRQYVRGGSGRRPRS